MKQLNQIFPIVQQLANYNKEKCLSDLVAAVVVTVMLIPQSLAYAMLAGLPAQYGLYASVMPIVVYSLLGTSTSLAVGPVAIASIMTASALSTVVASGLISYVDGAITLALLSGAMLFLLGLFRMGFIANFLSHSVVSGFITASGLLIALSQLKHIFGVSVSGHTFIEMVYGLIGSIQGLNPTTAIIGIGSLAFIFGARKFAQGMLHGMGLSKPLALGISRLAPIVGIVITTFLVAAFALDTHGVAIVGSIPAGIGQPQLPSLNVAAVKALALPAFFISIIGYVESISVGRTLASKQNKKITPNKELIALGGANITSGIFGAFPVTGGFARSVVNFDAGAQTQFAGIFTAIGIALVSLFLTQYLYYLPIAMLAATIIVAVLSLVDFSILKHAWHISRSDFVAMFLTIIVTLCFGVEAGVASGIISTILLHLYHTSKPHIAEVGLLPNSNHFRNIRHYKVETQANIVSLRIDESLLFSNASYLEDYIDEIVISRPQVKHVILHCGAVNTVDLTAMEMLVKLNRRLLEGGVSLHLSEVKVPVKLMLKRSNLIDELGGNIFLSHIDAYDKLKTRATVN
jgi:SulP family sulfate permease